MECLISVGNYAYQQERWHGSSLRSYHGMSDYVLGFECNGCGHYHRRYVFCYLGGRRGGGILTPAAHARFPCFEHRSIGIAHAELGVE